MVGQVLAKRVWADGAGGAIFWCRRDASMVPLGLTGRRCHLLLSQVLHHSGACAASFWSMCSPLSEQVPHLFGAGVVFGGGPAPGNGRVRTAMAQVSTLFPHLRHLPRGPAPSAHMGWTGYPPWFRYCLPSAQVPPPSGAGAASFRSRCGFWWGTCAGKWGCTQCGGAGLNNFSTPAPFTPKTCANKPYYLRQKPRTPAPN